MTERPWLLKTPAQAGERPGVSWKTSLWAILGLAVLFVWLETWWVMTAAVGVRTGPGLVEIPPHLGLVAVARRLDEAGLVRSPLGFMLLALVRGSARSLKAGEYEIPQGANSVKVLSLLEGGKVVQHNVLLREGGTLDELARLLAAERLASAEDVLRVAHDRVFLRTLGIQSDSVEGYLFPDTYQLVKGMTPDEILARMILRMRDQITPELLELARAHDLSVHQLLTLASIVEREAVDPKEMPLIAAVFWNRLKRDIPLQADPTVQYAVGKEGRALTLADLQIDSPFNTYRRIGLPPAPIANPGLAAIEAAVRPAPVNYLYFVSVNDRRHHFSTSLAEHNAAVARYRLAKTR